MTYRNFLFLLILMIYTACSGPSGRDAGLAEKSWEQITNEAEGKSLTMMMWMGDPFINNYMNDYVVPEVKERFGINLEIVSGQGTQIVSTLMSEIESRRTNSEIDMMWINGETFFQLRQIDALYGPFTDRLPNSQYIDFSNPFIGKDFQQPVDGYETPWGNVQLTIIYNSENVENPPQTLDELKSFTKSHPGRFTIPTEFTGMTLLKSMMISIAEDPDVFKGSFDEETYQKYSSRLWQYIREIKPGFWRNGETFPNSIAQLHQLFANGEIWFTFSNNDSEVDNKIAQGLFQDNSRAYVPEFGTIRNSHYLGISSLSSKKEAAMAVINFLISPEAQFEKMKPSVWGDGTVLDFKKLPDQWKEKFRDIPGRNYAPPRNEIKKYALMEPAPEYMIRIFEDFRSNVVN